MEKIYIGGVNYMIRKLNILIFNLFLHDKYGVANFEEYKSLLKLYKELLP